MPKKRAIEADTIESLGDGSVRTSSKPLENKLIAACFRRPSCLQTVTSNLQAESFSDPRLSVFYGLIEKAHKEGRFPDKDVILANAKRSSNLEIEPEDYDEALHNVLREQDEGLDVEAACHTIHDLHVIRQILGFAKRIDSSISEGKSSDELIGQAEEAIKRLSGTAIKNDTLFDIDQMVSRAGTIESILSPENSGVKSPTPELNELVASFGEGQLICIGARPGGGKTAYLIQCAFKAAETIPVSFFSHEMEAWDIWRRILCQQGLVRSHDIQHNTVSPTEMEKIKQYIKMSAPRNLRVSDSGGKTLLQLRSELARTKAKFGQVGMVCVDYLQLMKSPNNKDNRFQEVSTIARGLKELSMEFKAIIMAAVQLSRAVEQRIGGDNRPQLSDLRESGEIEQAADLVVFTHRPSINWKKANIPPPGDELIIAKQRRGPQGVVKVTYQGDAFRFVSRIGD